MKKFGLTAMALLLAAALGIAISVSATHANSGESADTTGAAPSGLTATYADGQLTLAWTKGTDATYLKQFIENRVAGATPADWWITVAPTDMESFALPAEMTVAGTTYDFRVSGAKLVNGVVTSVASSNVVTVAIPAAASGKTETPASLPQNQPEPAPAPSARPVKTRPSDLTASQAQFGNGVALTWTPGTNPNYTQQIVLRRVAEITPIVWNEFPIGVSDSAYTDYSAEPGYPYIYRVRAEKANDKGGETNAAQIIGPGAPDNRAASNLRIDSRGQFGRGVPYELRLLMWDTPRHPLYTTQIVVYTETYHDNNGVRHERTVRSLPYSGRARSVFFPVEPGRTYVYWVETHRSDSVAIKKFSETLTDVVPPLPSGPSVP